MTLNDLKHISPLLIAVFSLLAVTEDVWAETSQQQYIRTQSFHDREDYTDADAKVLARAAEQGNREALWKIGSIEVKQPDLLMQTYPPFIQANVKGDISAVKALTESGADVNVATLTGRTALWLAASRGQMGIVNVLVQAGTDPDARDWQGRTALHAAAVPGHIEIVDLLLKAGADVNAQDEDGHTALHNASVWGRTGVVDILINAGADTNAQSKSGNTALMMAIEHGYSEVVDALLRSNADVDPADRTGQTPLMFAIAVNHTRIALALIDAGADVNKVVVAGYLMTAAKNGNARIVKILIAAGADVDAREPSEKPDDMENALWEIKSRDAGMTALQWAIQYGHYKVAETLIAAGADVNLPDQDSMSPLHYASRGIIKKRRRSWIEVRSDKFVQLLLTAGANVNARDAKGRTPLTRALKNGNQIVIDMLKQNGASE